MDACLLVEEHSLKDLVFDASLEIAKLEPDIFVDNSDFQAKLRFVEQLKSFRSLVKNYQIVRDRNNEIRKEEYRNGISEGSRQ